VVFELMLVFALGLGAMFNGVARASLRNFAFLLILAAFVGLAWLGGSGSGLPYLWLAALWLLSARLSPPAGLAWFGREHRHWMFNDGMTSYVLVWVPAFFAYLLLMALSDGDCATNAAGERVCKSPAWIFAAVWVPYFIAEALVRAHRIAELHATRGARARP
jgi:hypothetical protein